MCDVCQYFPTFLAYLLSCSPLDLVLTLLWHLGFVYVSSAVIYVLDCAFLLGFSFPL